MFTKKSTNLFCQIILPLSLLLALLPNRSLNDEDSFPEEGSHPQAPTLKVGERFNFVPVVRS
jgi:hypothetical protein